MKEREKELDETIASLAKALGDMSTQFSVMLKDTLEKMKLRIEAANKQWETENESKIVKQT